MKNLARSKVMGKAFSSHEEGLRGRLSRRIQGGWVKTLLSTSTVPALGSCG